MNIEAGAPVARKVALKLKPDVSLDLRKEAKRRGVKYDALAAEIVDAVVSHRLFAAVLDQ
jgi:molybdate-binding protein